jgi:MYXO-CTERM domain-containing protein
MRWAAISGVIAIACAVARTAAAQDAGVPSATEQAEIAQLEQEIARGAAALSGGGCAVACRALASMERATERLCTLDPGPRCAEARAKVREATRRVQAACADCRSGDDEIRAAEKKPTAPASQAAPPPEPAPAPQTVSKRGGCAGCVVGGEDGAVGAGALAAIGLLIAIARRRRR